MITIKYGFHGRMREVFTLSGTDEPWVAKPKLKPSAYIRDAVNSDKPVNLWMAACPHGDGAGDYSKRCKVCFPDKCHHVWSKSPDNEGNYHCEKCLDTTKDGPEHDMDQIVKLRECLDFCRAAIGDAIYDEDGLDGGSGEKMIMWINDMIGTGSREHAKLENMQYSKKMAELNTRMAEHYENLYKMNPIGYITIPRSVAYEWLEKYRGFTGGDKQQAMIKAITTAMKKGNV